MFNYESIEDLQKKILLSVASDDTYELKILINNHIKGNFPIDVKEIIMKASACNAHKTFLLISENFHINDKEILNAIIEATKYGSIEILDLINSKYRSHIKESLIFEISCIYSQDKVIRFLEKKDLMKKVSVIKKNNGFISACEFGNLGVVQLILSNYSKYIKKNNKIITFAIKSNNTKLVEYLIEKNFELNLFNIHTGKDLTFIFLCEHGMLDVVTDLIFNNKIKITNAIKKYQLKNDTLKGIFEKKNVFTDISKTLKVNVSRKKENILKI